MARWVCEGHPRKILDPAVGTGVFLDAVDKILGQGTPTADRPLADAYDIDEKMLGQADRARGHLAVRMHHNDFITAPITERYDAIIANPPYVRHHTMNYGEEVFIAIDRLGGRRFSRLTNLYGLFLLKIWTLLKENGRAAVITPAEWLNADFGTPLKAFLLEENAIDAIIHFAHAARIFPGVMTTAAITLLRRGRSSDEGTTLVAVEDDAMLDEKTLSSGQRVTRTRLDPARKWRPLFESDVSSSIGTHCLKDVARCVRGIATGANHYFTLRESDRRRWQIGLEDVEPCITKAQQIEGDRLTSAHVRRLIADDQRIYLLNPRAELSAAVRNYLEEGRRLGIPERYLPAHRPVWYRPEHRKPAPLLVSVFARGPFRFVLNEANILNLTAYHAIYPTVLEPESVRALFEYLCSPHAAQALLAHQRIYAEGLRKVEPRDVEALVIPSSLYERCSGDAAEKLMFT